MFGPEAGRLDPALGIVTPGIDPRPRHCRVSPAKRSESGKPGQQWPSGLPILGPGVEDLAGLALRSERLGWSSPAVVEHLCIGKAGPDLSMIGTHPKTLCSLVRPNSPGGVEPYRPDLSSVPPSIERDGIQISVEVQILD